MTERKSKGRNIGPPELLRLRCKEVQTTNISSNPTFYVTLGRSTASYTLIFVDPTICYRTPYKFCASLRKVRVRIFSLRIARLLHTKNQKKERKSCIYEFFFLKYSFWNQNQPGGRLWRPISPASGRSTATSLSCPATASRTRHGPNWAPNSGKKSAQSSRQGAGEEIKKTRKRKLSANAHGRSTGWRGRQRCLTTASAAPVPPSSTAAGATLGSGGWRTGSATSGTLPPACSARETSGRSCGWRG